MILGQIKAQLRSGVRFAVGDVRVVTANEYRASLDRLKSAVPWANSEERVLRLKPWEQARPYITFKRLKELRAGAAAEIPLFDFGKAKDLTELTPAQLTLRLNENDSVIFDASLPRGGEPTVFVYTPAQPPVEFALADLLPAQEGEPAWASVLTGREAQMIRAYGQVLARKATPRPIASDPATSSFLPTGPRR